MASTIEYVLDQQDKAYVGIPLSLERLNGLIHCIDKGDSWIVTGQTGTFKSSFTLTSLVIPLVEYVLGHLKDGLDIKVFYFLLEENRRDLEIRILSYLYSKQYDVDISEDKLHGRAGEKLTVQERVLLRNLQPQLDLLLSKIDIHDDVRYGYTMSMIVSNFMLANGKRTKDMVTGEEIYVENNPDLYTFMVVDHLGELQPSEQEKVLFQAIENLTGLYAMKLKNTYRVIPLFVQQQENIGDRMDTDTKGKIIDLKLAPSTAKLADNKGTSRRATHIVGLLNPATYDLDIYRGYKNLLAVRENFLYLSILKNRRGPAKVGSGLWVNPVTKKFEEMPAHVDQMAVNRFIELKTGKGPTFGFNKL